MISFLMMDCHICFSQKAGLIDYERATAHTPWLLQVRAYVPTTPLRLHKMRHITDIVVVMGLFISRCFIDTIICIIGLILENWLLMT